jgi:hypothetical protein
MRDDHQLDEASRSYACGRARVQETAELWVEDNSKLLARIESLRGRISGAAAPPAD